MSEGLKGKTEAVLRAQCSMPSAQHIKANSELVFWDLSGRQAHLDRYLCFRAKSHEVIERKQFHLAASDFGEPRLRDAQLSSRLPLCQFVLLHPTPQASGQLLPQHPPRTLV